MAPRSPTLFDYANLADDHVVAKHGHVVAKSDQDDAFNEQVLRLCRTLWPGETVQQLSVNAKISVRQAQRLIGREQGFSAKVIRRLCHCHNGGPFLQLWMSGCQAAHWQVMVDDHAVGEIERQGEALEKQRQELRRRQRAGVRRDL
jgi:hypothetical protein